MPVFVLWLLSKGSALNSSSQSTRPVFTIRNRRDSERIARRERGLLSLALAGPIVALVTLIVSPAFGTHTPVGDLVPVAVAAAAFVLLFALAHVFLNRYLPRRDPFLLPAVALLTGLGLTVIARTAINFLIRQTVWLVVATVVAGVIVRVDSIFRLLRRFRYTWLLSGLALLATTLILGTNPSGCGPRLWLGMGGVYFQPAELLKLMLVVYLASYLAERGELIISTHWQVGRWRLPPMAYVGPLFAMLGLAMVLVAWQQDLGAAMLFFFTFLAMFYLATERWGYIVGGLGLFAFIGLVGYRFSGRIAMRIEGWLDPWPHAADRAFQIVQSLLAFGAGGLFGQGVGMGHPTYIPAIHTDFVFAAIGEELGLVGALTVIALYGILLLRGLRIAKCTPRPFERLLAAGLTASLVVQAWVIMAGNIKLTPIAGVTLPFVSYGGSSLLISFVSLALLLRISAVTSLHERPSLSLGRPFYRIGLALSLALLLLGGVCSYWAVLRADSLKVREDNPRRVLYEQRIRRGEIEDRNGVILATSEITCSGGEREAVIRRYPIPEAAPVVGYASLRYGTGGIEHAFDTILRGEAHRSAWQVAWAELLHQPPQGQAVQLTLDAQLQVQAQRVLSVSRQAGAVVLLDARNGDILAMASHPTFSPERLDEQWEVLRIDPTAPLLNRATQGLYQPGTALQTVVLAQALVSDLVHIADPVWHATATVTIDGSQLACSGRLVQPRTLGQAYAAACPTPFIPMGHKLGRMGLATAVARWGLTTAPPLEIPTEASDWHSDTITTAAVLEAEAIGQGRLTVSPLQMALVIGALANGGEMPAPRLVVRIQEPDGTWRSSPPIGQPRQVISPEIADALWDAWPSHYAGVRGQLALSIAGPDRPPHAWFLGVGPTPSPRYAVVVLLEQTDDPTAAIQIGTTLIRAMWR